MMTPAREFERGVFCAPWVTETGETVFFATTRTGRLVSDPIALARDVDPEVVLEWLRGRLDAIDPVSAFRIVR